MIKKVINHLDADVFYEELENGLKVYMLPFKNRSNYSIEYIAKYGSYINAFKSNKTNKKIKTPYGVAHFLEHKMFEQEDGTTPFSYYSKTGTDANASTGYRVTSYTVDGTSNIEENLDYLLNYVNSPHFTEENVEKEKGIIIEELNMYKDEPENRLYEESNKILFHKHPLRIDVGGTPRSVRKITKEILYDCYDTFYQPSNMILLIAGNFDPKKILKVIKNNKKLNSKKYNNEITVYKETEPYSVKAKEKEIIVKKMIIPKFIYTIKSSWPKYTKEEKYKFKVTLEIFLYCLYGMSSEFRENMLNKDMFSLFFATGVLVDDFMLIEFVSETKHPKEFQKEILKSLRNINITKKDVERVKKVKLSLEVLESDKPYQLLNSALSEILDYGDIVYNKIDIIKSITKEDVLKIKDFIDISNSSFIVGYPKE